MKGGHIHRQKQYYEKDKSRFNPYRMGLHFGANSLQELATGRKLPIFSRDFGGALFRYTNKRGK